MLNLRCAPSHFNFATVELVVNQIYKDQVQGYLREPRYKKSELPASTATPNEKSQDASAAVR
jgi:hypothetical protein